jgi:hypothetical protein
VVRSCEPEVPYDWAEELLACSALPQSCAQAVHSCSPEVRFDSAAVPSDSAVLRWHALAVDFPGQVARWYEPKAHSLEPAARSYALALPHDWRAHLAALPEDD